MDETKELDEKLQEINIVYATEKQKMVSIEEAILRHQATLEKLRIEDKNIETQKGELKVQKDELEKIGTDYKYGFHTDTTPVFDTGRGINEEVVKKISEYKNEPSWMMETRLKAYQEFAKMKWPTFGPNLDMLNFDEYIYYIKSTKSY